MGGEGRGSEGIKVFLPLKEGKGREGWEGKRRGRGKATILLLGLRGIDAPVQY